MYFCLPVLISSQSFFAREKLAMEPMNFLPVFFLAVFVTVAHKVALGATFEHSLKIVQGVPEKVSHFDSE